MKAVLLIRVSTAQQDISQQSEKVQQEALRDGYKPENLIIIEDHESGSKLNELERNGLNKMKAEIDKGGVDRVYCWELSRISRKAGVVFSIRDWLIERGIQLVVLSPYFRMLKDDGTLSEMSNIFFSLFAGLAENEGYLRNERIMRGKAKKMAEGRLTSGIPLYGYSIGKDKKPYINDNEGAIVKEIYRRRDTGESEGMIGREMWERGVFGKIKLNSCVSRVSRILNDPRYKGGSIYPALVSDLSTEENGLDGSSKRHGKFVRKIRTNNDVYMLGGLLYSEEGYTLTPSPACGRYAKANDTQAISIAVNMKIADKIARYALDAYVSNGGGTNTEEERKELNKIIKNLEAKIIEADKKIESLRKENNRIEERIIKGRMDENKGDAMMDDNFRAMNNIEDNKVGWNNAILAAENRLAFLANPMFAESEKTNGDNSHDRALIKRHCERIICKKVGFGTFIMDFRWVSMTSSEWMFHSTGRSVKIWKKVDETFELIEQSNVKLNKKKAKKGTAK